MVINLHRPVVKGMSIVIVNNGSHMEMPNSAVHFLLLTHQYFAVSQLLEVL